MPHRPVTVTDPDAAEKLTEDIDTLGALLGLSVWYYDQTDPF